jgi:hypothetical protein
MLHELLPRQAVWTTDIDELALQLLALKLPQDPVGVP